jgi:hypothetical protein
MIVKETRCKKDILKILNNDDIYKRMVSDDIKGKKPKVSFEYKKYIGCYVDNNIVGVCIYREFDKGSVVHFYVLSDFRKACATDFAKKCLSFKPDGELFAITPNCFREVIKFAISIGFERFGIHKEEFTKNKINYKQVITRFNQ